MSCPWWQWKLMLAIAEALFPPHSASSMFYLQICRQHIRWMATGGKMCFKLRKRIELKFNLAPTEFEENLAIFRAILFLWEVIWMIVLTQTLKKPSTDGTIQDFLLNNFVHVKEWLLVFFFLFWRQSKLNLLGAVGKKRRKFALKIIVQRMLLGI